MLAGVVFVCAAAAQSPRVGDINVYGLHKLTAEKILSDAGLASGGALPPSKGDLEDQIAKSPGVSAARVEAVCCNGSQTDLFIGIEERGETEPAFHSPPSGSITLPENLLSSYRDFLSAVMRAAGNGSAEEDMSSGSPLIADRAVRGYQDRFIAFAAEHADLLREALRSDSVAEERAAAATVIGYGTKKQEIVDSLQYALQDPDETVRSNALHALTAIAVLADKQPALGLKISPTWMVELLKSIVLSDRMESTRALLALTGRGDRAALDLIRERALPFLAEMARWKTLSYALPPFLLLGRAAGVPDTQLHESWQNGQRDQTIDKALAAGKKRG